MTITQTDGDRKLGLDDIADTRAYEREREAFREHIIALKKRRRIGVGPHVTLLFENRDTIRFQIQEMARVEKLLTDDAIDAQLRAYNPLIPEPGQVSATMFIELTSEELLKEWLPKLVGVETHVVIRLGDGSEVRCEVDPAHEAQLTRDDITASVHYVHWNLTVEQIDTLERLGASVAIDHLAYPFDTALTQANVQEFLADLRG